jgi:hypothetical protein
MVVFIMGGYSIGFSKHISLHTIKNPTPCASGATGISDFNLALFFFFLEFGMIRFAGGRRA